MKSRNNIITLLAPIGLKHTQTPCDNIVCFEKDSDGIFIHAAIDHETPHNSVFTIKATSTSSASLELYLSEIPKMAKFIHTKPEDVSFDGYMSAAATLSSMFERLRGISPFKGNLCLSA